MSETSDDVAALYTAWPVEKLVRAAYVEHTEYADDAVRVMRGVLEARGVSPADIEAILADLERGGAGDPLDHVRGWLLIFVIHVAVTTMSFGLTAAVVFLGAGGWADVTVAVISAAVAGYGAYCSYVLTRRRPQGRGHALGLMIAWAAASVAIGAILAATSDASLNGVGRPFLYALLWTPYLLYSKRVARVYSGRT